MGRGKLTNLKGVTELVTIDLSQESSMDAIKISGESLVYNLHSLKVSPYNLLFKYEGEITAVEKLGRYQLNQTIQVNINNGRNDITCLFDLKQKIGHITIWK